MDVLAFLTLTITGFIACAEFGSYAFVHPVLRRLPPRERIDVEQGLLKTFGRVMPLGMTASLVLAVVFAGNAPSPAWAWTAPAVLLVSLITTIAVNVPINRATGHWDTEQPPPGWERTRRRWEIFQGIRSWLLLTGFVLISAAVVS